MKSIDTLIDDITEVIHGRGGWNNVIGEELGKNIARSAAMRFSKPQKPRGYLSLSSVGTPCKRKLWFKVNKPELAKPLGADMLLRFFYGDIIEELILSFARIAGHKVEGMQDRLEVHGIKGHRDAVIDGITVDVKSCSPFSFKKFERGELRDNDPFGYISQLSSYVYAGKDDDLVVDKNKGAFLAIDKVGGGLTLDMYDFSNELPAKADEIAAVKDLVAGTLPKDRVQPIPQSKGSPNTKLAKDCSFCEFRKECWPNVRTFKYSYGEEYLVHVEKEPKVPEIK